MSAKGEACRAKAVSCSPRQTPQGPNVGVDKLWRRRPARKTRCRLELRKLTAAMPSSVEHFSMSGQRDGDDSV